MKICIVGLGYVGLPLGLSFVDAGVQVIGLDVDQAKCDALNDGKSYIEHIPSAHIQSAVETGLLTATTDFARVEEVNAVIICVPTPLDHHRQPDLSYVLDTARRIAPHVQKGCVISLESTTYPGTTEGELLPIIESISTLKAGEDFFLIYSPEREDPGNPDSKVRTIPKVIGGYTPNCLEKGKELYRKVVDTLVPVADCKTAEATKLTENIFRSVNIALVNELKVIYQKMGIDVWQVIDAAKTKPFGFMPFYPGPGLGGHCIPIDPFYLTWKAREYGVHTRFIELAGEVNDSMIDYTVSRLAEALNDQKKALHGSRVLVLGLAYKPDVDDMRESPSFRIMDQLQEKGAQVEYHDPHIPVITPTREHKQWTGKESTPWDEKTIATFDAILIATHHACVDYTQLAEWAECIVDSRNAMNEMETGSGQVVKA